MDRNAINERCGRCRMWKHVPQLDGPKPRKDEEAPARQGMCQRFPPTVNVVMTPNVNLMTQERQLVPMNSSSWPVLDENQWCGEFAALFPSVDAGYRM